VASHQAVEAGPCLCSDRPPLLDQAVDTGRDGAPIGKPIARKPESQGGIAERPFIKTHRQSEIATRTVATNQEAIRLRRVIENILALIRRTIRKRLDGEAAGIWLWRDVDIARID